MIYWLKCWWGYNCLLVVTWPLLGLAHSHLYLQALRPPSSKEFRLILTKIGLFICFKYFGSC